jgi:release factor glutamine methyltransferase
MTLREWLQKAEAHLRVGPHPDRARRDAELLLLYVVRRERAALLARWNEKLDEQEAARYVDLIERRRAGEPIQYILGETEFYGLPFRVTRDVLIPRPETEHLVERVIALAAQFARPRIVDVGTGSGAIAIALAHTLTSAEITAIDLSAPALAIAQENAARNGVDARICFLRGNLLEPVTAAADPVFPEIETRFDFVVSNPPYVPRTDRETLSVEVRDYEPALALFAGDDGLEVYRRLIPAAFAALNSGGHIALEIGFGQRDAVAALLEESGFRNIDFTPDLQGIPRVACAQRPSVLGVSGSRRIRR